MSLPGKIVTVTSGIVRDVSWAFIKGYWPFLVGAGVIVVGMVYLGVRASRDPTVRALAPMLIPGGPAVKAAAAAASMQGSRRSRRGAVLLGDLYLHTR
jgi:hypothetical protein